MLFTLLYGKYEYQWGIVFDNTEIQLGLFLNVIIPKIIKLFEDAIPLLGHGSSLGQGVH